MKNENNSELLYKSPEVEIYETREQGVICQSRTCSPEDYEFEDWDLE